MQVSDRQLVHLVFNELSRVSESSSGTHSVNGQATSYTQVEGWVSFPEQTLPDGIVNRAADARPGEQPAANRSFRIDYVDVGWSIELIVSDSDGRPVFSRSCLDAEANTFYVAPSAEGHPTGRTEQLRGFLLAALLHCNWTPDKPPLV